ncbi:MAG TPA: prolyl oligopeptidase family serine peptidase [Rhodanobacteraceae bacterium]|jgi:dipeptidyl aminopeptidase/acylaminoacyl peptidase|nr:prolyl oligopeptidase family serine peptidase [Rhodanobacteraceae bacterium]
MYRLHGFMLAALFVMGVALAPPPCAAASPQTGFTLAQVLSYPYPLDLASSEHGDRIAWVVDQNGVRNVWVARAPDFKPQRVTRFTQDDGQEITQLTFSPSGDALVFVRGGDHDANWPVKVAVDPASSPVEPKVTIWSVDLQNGTSRELTEGDAPAISSDGKLAYIKDDQVWTAPLSANDKAKPKRLFFDHGKDGDLHWSPDGKRLAFVSNRGDHAFIGVFTGDATPVLYLSPSAEVDGDPRWSPDGALIAFTRQPGNGGPPQPILEQTPQPWSIRVADARSGQARVVWQSPDTLVGSYPQTAGGANLHWADGGAKLVFLADLDGWPHLYSIGANGGEPLLLTPGKFMVEDVVMAPDVRSLVYSANTGTTKNDNDRRHLFRVPVDRAQPVALTSGAASQWSPTIASANAVAFVDAGAQRPPLVSVMHADGSQQKALQADLIPKDFPTAQLVIPQAVTFKAADGTPVQGQLFRSADAGANQPGMIFVHGGPPRQMLLGWHYMDYYTNSYAVNQYLATHGFTVLSVNYRLGIGYGHAFHNPPHWGPTGASEYQDVVAGAKYLQHVPGVDATRIGIWGGSYGGYLTALALARNSDIFKAGVDMHGVHDWSRDIAEWFGKPDARYEQGDYRQALKVAWDSSPDADIAKWKSPVLLIQGDDDHNVHFFQMTDIVPRLKKHGVPFEEMVIPNEIHGFLRHASWMKADTATVDFLQRKLGNSTH